MGTAAGGQQYDRSPQEQAIALLFPFICSPQTEADHRLRGGPLPGRSLIPFLRGSPRKGGYGLFRKGFLGWDWTHLHTIAKFFRPIEWSARPPGRLLRHFIAAQIFLLTTVRARAKLWARMKTATP